MPSKRKRPAPKRCAPCYHKRFQACDPALNPLCKLTGVVPGSTAAVENASFTTGGETLMTYTALQLSAAQPPTGAGSSVVPNETTQDAPVAAQNTVQAIGVPAHDTKSFNVGNRSILNIMHVSEPPRPAVIYNPVLFDSEPVYTHSVNDGAVHGDGIPGLEQVDAQDMRFAGGGFSTTAAATSVIEQSGPPNIYGLNHAVADAKTPYPTTTSASSGQWTTNALRLRKPETVDDGLSSPGTVTKNNPANTESLFGPNAAKAPYYEAASTINNKYTTAEEFPGIQSVDTRTVLSTADISNTTKYSPTTVERLLTPDASSLSSVPLTPAPDAMGTSAATAVHFSSNLAALDRQYQQSLSERPSPAFSLITTAEDTPMQDADVPMQDNTGAATARSGSVRDVATLTDDALTGYNPQHVPLHETGLNALVGQMCQEPQNAGNLLRGCMDEYAFDVEILRSKIHAAGLDVSFCEARWTDMAPRAGLLTTDDEGKLQTFELQRARLHDYDFNHLVTDLNRVSLQYGLLPDAESADAGSRIFEIYLNNFVPLFGGLMSMTTGSILGDLSTTKGRGHVVHQFSTYGKVNLLFIEVMKSAGREVEKLNFFAQAIAELEARSWQNSQLKKPGEPDLPIVAILTDATALYFFQLSRPATASDQQRPRPIVRMGKFDYPSHGTHVPITCSATDSLETIVRNTRAIADTLYFIFLRQFYRAVREHLDWTLQMALRVGGNAYNAPQASNWERAKESVKRAMDAAVLAGRVHEDGNPDYAGRSAWDGAMTLKKSLEKLPGVPSPFMAGYTENMARW